MNASASFGMANLSTTLPIFAWGELTPRLRKSTEGRRVRPEQVRTFVAASVRPWRGMVDFVRGLSGMPTIEATLMRLYPERRMELSDEELIDSLETVRLGVADGLRVHGPGIVWKYRLEPASAYAVRIEIQCEGTNQG